MSARNDITGAEIKSKSLSKEGRDNWDNIFKPKKSGYDWVELKHPGCVVYDPDGWRHNDGVDMNTLITEADFDYRCNRSTVIFTKSDNA